MGSKGISATQLESWNNGILPGGFIRGNNNETGTSIPKAYVNYIFLDEQFKFAGGGWSRVGASGTVKQHWTDGLQNINVPKNGYLFVYVSNESNFNVFFDNLQVVHTKGTLAEETHYYPFGLVMSGISSKAAGGVENKKKFNGIELNTDFDINSYDAFYRNYDPQIGRFWQIDPKPNEMISSYAGMINNPVRFMDPLGDTVRVSIGGNDYYIDRLKNGGVGYFGSDGKQYTGDLDDFSQSVLDAVNVMAGANDEKVQTRLNTVLGGKKIITIQEGGVNDFSVDEKTGNATLTWSNTNNNGIRLNNGGDIEKPGAWSKYTRDKDLVLGHELLGHGYQFQKNMLNHDRMEPAIRDGFRVIGWAKKVEADAVNIANRIALTTGRPQMVLPVYTEIMQGKDGRYSVLHHMIPSNYFIDNQSSQVPSNYRFYYNSEQ